MAQISERWANHLARQAARAQEPTAPVPTGRVVVTGTVVAQKTSETQWGTTYKILIKSPIGFKVWCSEPSNWYADKGDEITVKVTIEASPDDVTFGFGKRPTLVVAK